MSLVLVKGAFGFGKGVNERSQCTSPSSHTPTYNDNKRKRTRFRLARSPLVTIVKHNYELPGNGANLMTGPLRGRKESNKFVVKTPPSIGKSGSNTGNRLSAKLE